MSKSFVFLLLLGCCLSACVSQPVADPNEVSELELVSNQIKSLEANLSEKIALGCSQPIKKLGQKIDKKIKRRVVTKVVERCSSPRKTNKKGAESYSAKRIDGKIQLGAVEEVRLIKEKVSYAARIDTGADTSSIGVFNAKGFERDGKNWVRFTLENGEDAPSFEYPIYDTVRIKQSKSVTVDRIEIKMDLEMGGKKYKKQIFNLADRSYLEYQLLMGRSFLRDIAVVDVSRKNIQKSK